MNSAAQRIHLPVLLEEAVSALIPAPSIEGANRCFVDATFGRGGHSRALCDHLGPTDRLAVFDRDPEAIAVANQLARQDNRIIVHHGAFSTIDRLENNSVDGLLFDFGVSSPQIDDPLRGFSFRADGPLDMRMDNTQGVTVSDWIATESEANIAKMIKEYGEDRFAKVIAKAICTHRQHVGMIQSTAVLASIVAGAVKTREAGQHPATRTFQAFRIYINQELEQIRQALAASLRLLKIGARLVVISFHSLEDRIVKQFIAAHAREQFDRNNPFAALAQEKVLPLKVISRIKPSPAEIERNPRARSAIMRVAEKVASC